MSERERERERERGRERERERGREGGREGGRGKSENNKKFHAIREYVQSQDCTTHF